MVQAVLQLILFVVYVLVGGVLQANTYKKDKSTDNWNPGIHLSTPLKLICETFYTLVNTFTSSNVHIEGWKRYKFLWKRRSG